MKHSIKVIFWIMKHSKGVLPLIALTSTLSGILAIIGVYSAFLSKSLVDAATHGQMEEVIKWLVITAGLYFVRLALNSINSIASTYSSTRLSNQLQTKVYRSLTYSEWLAQSKYHSGNLLTRVTRDVSTVSSVILSSLNSLISISVTFVSSFIALYYIDSTIAIFTVVATPSFLLLSKFYSRRLKKIYNEQYDQNTLQRSFLQESIQNLMIIKTFCFEEQNFQTLKEHHQERLHLGLKSTKFSIISSVVFGTMSYFIYFIIYGISVLKITTGAMSFGSMTAMLQLYYKVTGPLKNVASIAKSFIGGITAAERLMELEDLPHEQFHDQINLEIMNKPTVEFKNIAFSYTDNQPILKDISFEITPGETVALVGPSGEGKTTIIKLILSLLPLKSGKILIKTNHAIQNLTREHRQLISYVPQGNTLFSGTIRENIQFGTPEATEEQIIVAAKQAYAWDFIEKLELGLDTPIGEKGLGLSEGQAQRVAIARAFLRQKPILILDEATSALDPTTELNILNSVKNLSHQPMCLIITHRPAALEICDRILKLESGHLTEINH